MSIPALFTEVELSRISVPANRLRDLRPETVDALVESIGRQGLLQPIRVEVTKDGYRLIAGRHRFEAVRKLGHPTILAGVVKDIDADQAQLDEIDENLVRAELSPAERALHIGRRKELYEKLYPETKHGAVGRGREKSRQAGDFHDRFTKDTASKLGQSERSIQRDATRYKKVVVLDDIKGTSLDKGEEIDALVKRSEDEQIELAERAKAGEEVTARNVLGDAVRSVVFMKVMASIRSLGGGNFCNLVSSMTLTEREVRKARADIKKAMEELHALDVSLAAVGDDEGTGRPTRSRAVGDSTMLCVFMGATDKSLPLLNDAELKKAKSYVASDQWRSRSPPP